MTYGGKTTQKPFHVMLDNTSTSLKRALPGDALSPTEDLRRLPSAWGLPVTCTPRPTCEQLNDTQGVRFSKDNQPFNKILEDAHPREKAVHAYVKTALACPPRSGFYTRHLKPSLLSFRTVLVGGHGCPAFMDSVTLWDGGQVSACTRTRHHRVWDFS